LGKCDVFVLKFADSHSLHVVVHDVKVKNINVFILNLT